MNNLKQFQDHAYKKTSQNKEDGLLNYIYNDIGGSNKKGIEVCCGSGIQCNLTNLIHTHKLDCLFFDKSDKLMEKGLSYWDKFNHQPHYINDYLTLDKLKEHIANFGFDGNIDILSLDIDGLDYWFMKSLKEYISPRIIVLEFQDIIPIDLSMTVPYKEKFSGWNKWAKGGPNWSGASLKSFVELLDKYNFVGTEPKGFNAFFIRKDIKTSIPVIDDLNCTWEIRDKEKQDKLKQRWEIVKGLPWKCG
jgi:hypothetical protein